MTRAEVCVSQRCLRGLTKQKNPVSPLMTLSKSILPFSPQAVWLGLELGRCESQFSDIWLSVRWCKNGQCLLLSDWIWEWVGIPKGPVTGDMPNSFNKQIGFLLSFIRQAEHRLLSDVCVWSALFTLRSPQSRVWRTFHWYRVTQQKKKCSSVDFIISKWVSCIQDFIYIPYTFYLFL